MSVTKARQRSDIQILKSDIRILKEIKEADALNKTGKLLFQKEILNYPKEVVVHTKDCI